MWRLSGNATGVSNGTAIALAVAVVLLIVLVAYVATRKPKWGHVEYWRAALVETPDEVFDRSSGVFDEAAASALERSERRPGNPADHRRAAKIITATVLAQAVDQGLRDRMRLRAGRHMREAVRTLDGSRIARDEMGRAARRAVRHAAARGAQRDASRVTTPTPEPPETPPAGTILDEILMFAIGGGDPLPGNPFPGLAGGLQIEEVVFDRDLAGASASRRETAVKARKAAARETVARATGGAAGAGAEAEAFLDLSQRNTSDRQNSHDTSVNAAKRHIVAILREDQNREDLPSLEEIEAAIVENGDELSRDPASGRARPALVEKAVAVVRRAGEGSRSMSADATDGEVLRRVWARASHPRNADNHPALRQAVFDALVDSWERGVGKDSIQCVDGRISRMIGALTLLDFDERTWKIRRLEQHKNDVFVLAGEEIRAAASAAASGADPARAAVGRSFLARTPAELEAAGETDPETEAAWVAETRVRVGAAVEAHIADVNATTPGAIPERMADEIKKEALAALATDD